MKNNYITASLEVKRQNIELVKIGSLIQVPCVAEIFPHINAHKIRAVELEVKKWSKAIVQTGPKMSV